MTTPRRKQRSSNGKDRSENRSLDLHMMYDVPSDKGLREYYVELKYWPKRSDKVYILKVRMRRKITGATKDADSGSDDSSTWGEVILKLRVSSIMEGILVFIEKFGLPG